MNLKLSMAYASLLALPMLGLSDISAEIVHVSTPCLLYTSDAADD